MTALPKGWTATNLGSVGRWSSGGTPRRGGSGFYGGPIAWAKSGDLNDGILNETDETITECGLNACAAKLIEPGAVLVALYGATIGRVSINAVQCATNQAVAYCIPYPDSAIAGYIFWFVVSSRQALRELGQGGAQPNISQAILKSYPICLPPVAEQRRIVARIESLFARTRRARADLKRVAPLKTAATRAAFRAGLSGQLTADWRALNPSVIWTKAQRSRLEENRQNYLNGRRGTRLSALPEFREPGSDNALPSTWARGCIADTSTLMLGYAFKSEWFDSSGPKLLRGANIAPGQLDWSDEKRLSPSLVASFADYRLQSSDIVIAMDRPIISTGLKIARVPIGDEGALLVQRVASPKPTEVLDADFLWYFLHGSEFQDQISGRATGSDLPHVSANDILSTPMPLPPLPEQREIARRLEVITFQLLVPRSDAVHALTLLDRLEQSILACAFRGELVPQDPADEPARLPPAPVASHPPRRRAAPSAAAP